MLFSETCTIFNQFENTDGDITWYAHIIKNVHIDTSMAEILKKTGGTGNDSIQLHIAYEFNDDERYINSGGALLKYLPPKEWLAEEDTITFNPGTDFFIIEKWDGDSPINDDDYNDRRSEGFYAYMNRTKDYVYKITKVQRYNVIPHFELLGE